MNRIITTLNLLLAVVLVFALSSLTGTQANAATGKISACANKSTGALRLAPPKCKSTERTVSWNSQGSSGSNAEVRTKLVTLTYLGDPTSWLYPCGSDGPTADRSLEDDYQILNTGFLGNINSSSSWEEITGCTVTLNVVVP